MYTQMSLLTNALYVTETEKMDLDLNGCKYFDKSIILSRITDLMINTVHNKISPIVENINAQTTTGYTALMIACDNYKLIDYHDVINYLLVNKADPNLKNNNGDTALILATSSSKMARSSPCRADTRIVKLLLDYGADKTIKNNQHNDAFDELLFDIDLSQNGIKHNIELAKILINKGSKKSLFNALVHCNKENSYGLELIELIMDNEYDINNEIIYGFNVHYPKYSQVFEEMSCNNKTHYNNGSLNVAINKHPDYTYFLINHNLPININIIEDALCIAINYKKHDDDNNESKNCSHYNKIIDMLINYIDNHNIKNNKVTNRLKARGNLSVLEKSHQYSKFICDIKTNTITEDNRYVQCVQRYWYSNSRMDLIPILEFTKKFLVGSEIGLFSSIIKNKLMITYPNFTELIQFVDN